METNLKKIEKTSKIKNDENWEFRSFLKGCDISLEDLDSIVHELFDYVSSEIDCTKCANCCKKVSPILNKNDIKKLSKSVGISIPNFKKQFLKKKNGGDYTFNRLPCPFLENNICTQYKYRPNDCESYPHLHKEEFVFRLIGVVNNYSICPIVFNVYELLKERIWEDSFPNDFDEFFDFDD
ncbi:MAG: YkgJ family cysteine cluster protein [Desulfobacteraceae bacterium]|nr:YkgJ family cysteine cluster protein [Desulfobacteraceae bacterium]